MRVCRLLPSLALLIAGAAHGASVVTVASLGDAAPGGGIYAGPGFIGSPAAAGDGWVALRTLVTGGTASEEIVLANLNPSRTTRVTVARSGMSLGAAVGTIDDFVGHPAVNEDGTVAFVATIDPPEPPAEGEPTPALLLRFDVGSTDLEIVARSGDLTQRGRLALADPFMPGGDVDPIERTPALNEDGDVAWVAAVFDETDQPDGGGVFLQGVNGGPLELIAATGDALGAGVFTDFGPPAMNDTGAVAFRAQLSGAGPGDGVFLARNGGVSLVVGAGEVVTTTAPSSHQQTLTRFGDVVAVNDQDDVAFLGGPLLDFTNDPDDTDGEFGVLLARGVSVHLLAFPGLPFEDRGRITGARLLPEFSGIEASPHVTDAGEVVFYATLNGGSSEAILRAPSPTDPLEAAVIAGGGSPTNAPVGGSFSVIAAPPVVDDLGAVVVDARVVGTATQEGVMYVPRTGTGGAIVVGEGSPTNGFFAGPPFANPNLNERGDVVFRSTLASGSSAGGLFRWREGTVVPLVRTGETAPVAGNPPFLDIVGEHDTNRDGVSVFAAVVEGVGRGIYAADAAGVTKVAIIGDSLRVLTGQNASFLSVVAGPSIADDGRVAFRGRVEFPEGGGTARRDGIFLLAGNQMRSVVLAGEESPLGLPFFRFRELDLAVDSQLTFVASVGENEEQARGLFLFDGQRIQAIAVEGDSLAGRLESLSGSPSIDRRGAVTQLGRIVEGGVPKSVVLLGTPGNLQVVAEAGTSGPAGGIFRSFGRPAIARDGTVAFRATFENGTGGVAGVFLADGTTLSPYLGIGDPAPSDIGGRLVSFNQRVSLNDADSLAFIASIGGGARSNALFLAAPTTLALQRFKMRTGTTTKPDRLTMKLVMNASTLGADLDPSANRVTLTLRDSGATNWSVSAGPGAFRGRKRSFTYSQRPALKKMKLRVKRDGTIKAAVKARPELTSGGLFPIVPPISVELEIGDVSAQGTANCIVSARRTKCQ